MSTHNCTIVSAYLEFPSKFSHQKYRNWIKTFLKIRTPMVIFTDQRQFIQEHRDKDLPIHIIDCTTKDLFVYKYMDQWTKHHNMDREKRHHNVNLYMIWNEKSNFIKRAIDINPFNSEYFYWTDIGAFREPNRINQFLEYPKKVTNKILLLQINPFQPHEQQIDKHNIKNNFYHVDRIGGGIFGGHKSNCLKWHRKYYRMLEKFFEAGQFAGKDQSIMATVAILNPDLVHIVHPHNAKYDPWFYLEEWLCD